MRPWQFDQWAFLEAIERKRLGDQLSKRELARTLGVGSTRVIEISTRGRTPKMDLVMRLLEWLGDDIWDYGKTE